MKKTLTRTLTLLLLASSLVSCTTSLTRTGKQVRVLQHSDPPKECREIGSVRNWTPAPSKENVINGLKNAAAKAGGDLIVISGQLTMEASGIAYNCQKKVEK